MHLAYRLPYFVVKPNTTGAPRVGSIVFGEKAWEVRQTGQ